MLEHAPGLERKVSRGNLTAKNTHFVLVLCGNEYHWHLSQLEDFVFFYNLGIDGAGDPFSRAEVKYIHDKKTQEDCNREDDLTLRLHVQAARCYLSAADDMASRRKKVSTNMTDSERKRHGKN
jgi:hypothetical protein